jgi:hypothetical protein
MTAPIPTEIITAKIAQGTIPSTSPTDAANGWKTRIAPINEIMWSSGIPVTSAIVSGAITKQMIVTMACEISPDRSRGGRSVIRYSL